MLLSSSAMKTSYTLPCSCCHRRQVHAANSIMSYGPREWNNQFHLKPPELDFDYLCNESNAAVIKQNIMNRKGIGDLDKLVSN